MKKNHKHKFFSKNKNERWETYWTWKGKLDIHKNIKGKEIENASTSTLLKPDTKKKMKCFHCKRLGHAIKYCKIKINVEKTTKM
jgi:hypothetical protein